MLLVGGTCRGQVGGRGSQEGHAGDDGHQRGDRHGQRVGQPAPVQQCRAGVTECAEHHGPGTEKLRGINSDVDAEQGHHAGEADDQAEGASAIGELGFDQPQREHGREQRIGRGENSGYRELTCCSP
jgi:hypothetical protein